MHLPRYALGTVTTSTPLVQQIAAAITQQEGNTSGNNPGNLVYAGQPGATPGPGGFAVFSTPAAGQAAEANQIALDINRGSCATGAPIVTEADLITCWAPPSANDTATYIANVSAWTGISPTAPLATLAAGGATQGSGDGLSLPADTGAGTTDASAGIDLTDPTTLAVIGGLGLVAFLIFRR